MAAYKQWIAGSLSPAGQLRLDAGAVAALQAGKSLLAAGVTAVSGDFEKGDCVRLTDPSACRSGWVWPPTPPKTPPAFADAAAMRSRPSSAIAGPPS